MEVEKTYLVKIDAFIQMGVLFKCKNGKWFLQREMLMQSFETDIRKITESEALNLIKKTSTK